MLSKIIERNIRQTVAQIDDAQYKKELDLFGNNPYLNDISNSETECDEETKSQVVEKIIMEQKIE